MITSYSLLRLGFLPEPERQALYAAGVRTSLRLIACAQNAPCRKSLSEKAAMSEEKLMTLANRLDMLRVKGIGEDYCVLLVDVGINSRKELGAAEPLPLWRKLKQANDKVQKVRQMPNVQRVMRWVEEAKTLPPLG